MAESKLDHRIATHEGMRLSAERRRDSAEKGRIAAQSAVRYVRQQLAEIDMDAVTVTVTRLADHAAREARALAPDYDLIADLDEARRLLLATRELSI